MPISSFRSVEIPLHKKIIFKWFSKFYARFIKTFYYCDKYVSTWEVQYEKIDEICFVSLTKMTCSNAFTAARILLTLTSGLLRVARRKHVYRDVVDKNLTYYLLIKILILRCQGNTWEFVFNKCFNFNSMECDIDRKNMQFKQIINFYQSRVGKNNDFLKN